MARPQSRQTRAFRPAIRRLTFYFFSAVPQRSLALRRPWLSALIFAPLPALISSGVWAQGLPEGPNTPTVDLSSGNVITIDGTSLSSAVASAGQVVVVEEDAFATAGLNDFAIDASAGNVAVFFSGTNVSNRSIPHTDPSFPAVPGVLLGDNGYLIVDSGALLGSEQVFSQLTAGAQISGDNVVIDILDGGEVLSQQSPGIVTDGGDNRTIILNNAGSILAAPVPPQFNGTTSTPAIRLSGAVGSTIVNSGEIFGGGTATAIEFQDSRGDAAATTTIQNIYDSATGARGDMGAIRARRGNMTVENTGFMDDITISIDPDSDGFDRPETSVLVTNTAVAGLDPTRMGRVSVGGISEFTRNPATTFDELHVADLTITNGAGASISGITAAGNSTFDLTNSGEVVSGSTAIIFAAPDTTILNNAGAEISQTGFFGSDPFLGPSRYDLVGIYGNVSTREGPEIPRIDNSGTIIGELRGIEIEGRAEIINRSGGVIRNNVLNTVNDDDRVQNGRLDVVAISLQGGYVENLAGATIEGGVRFQLHPDFDTEMPYLLNTGSITNDNIDLGPEDPFNPTLVRIRDSYVLDGVVFWYEARLYGATVGSAHTGSIDGGMRGVYVRGSLGEDLRNGATGTINGGRAGLFIVDAGDRVVRNDGTISGDRAAIVFSDESFFGGGFSIFPSARPPFANGDFGRIVNGSVSNTDALIRGGVVFERLFDPATNQFADDLQPDSTVGLKGGRIENFGLVEGVNGNSLGFVELETGFDLFRSGSALQSVGGIEVVNHEGGVFRSYRSTFAHEFQRGNFLTSVFATDLDLTNAGLIEAGREDPNVTGTAINIVAAQAFDPSDVATFTSNGVFFAIPLSLAEITELANVTIVNEASGRIHGSESGIDVDGDGAIVTRGTVRGDDLYGIRMAGDMTLDIERLTANPDPDADPNDPLPPAVFGGMHGLFTDVPISFGDDEGDGLTGFSSRRFNDAIIKRPSFTITNDGEIRGESGDGARLAGEVTFTNSSIITGGDGGVRGVAFFLQSNAFGGYDNVIAESFLDFMNTAGGTIVGDTGIGLGIEGGILDLNNAGMIMGATDGVSVSSGEFNFSFDSDPNPVPVAGRLRSFVNSGTVTGSSRGVFVQGFSPDAAMTVFRNNGIITGASTGLEIENFDGEIVENEAGGQIRATGTGSDATGIRITGGSGTIVNQATATIQGSGDGDGSGGAIFYVDSEDAGSLTITNHGLLDGDVYLARGDDALTISVTGMLDGSASGGAGADTLAIDRASGETLAIGSGDFRAFETVTLNGTGGATGAFQISGTVFEGADQVILERGSLSGVGTIDGSLTVGRSDTATLVPGTSPGVVTVTGDLVLTANSVLDYELGQSDNPASVLNDRIDVGGNLTLGGSISVAETMGGTFGLGVYRLINFDGMLNGTASDLSILGVLPNGLTGTIQALTGLSTNQVNLVVTNGGPGPDPDPDPDPDPIPDITYWDGPNMTPGNVALGRGGTGIWNASNTNWTVADGSQNGPWDLDLGVFVGSAGTVTVVDNQVFNGLQFIVDGYTLVAGTDGMLDLDDGAFVHTDFGVTATFEVGVQDGAGGGRMAKTGGGSLVLAGANSLEGLDLRAGSVEVSGTTTLDADATMGDGLAATETVLTVSGNLDAPGGISGDDGRQTIIVSGRLDAPMDLGDGNDRVVNRFGRIESDIQLGDGDDILEVFLDGETGEVGGEIAGTPDGGAGSDTIVYSLASGTFTLQTLPDLNPSSGLVNFEGIGKGGAGNLIFDFDETIETGTAVIEGSAELDVAFDLTTDIGDGSLRLNALADGSADTVLKVRAPLMAQGGVVMTGDTEITFQATANLGTGLIGDGGAQRVLLDDAAIVDGDVATGAGNDLVQVSGGAVMRGMLDGGESALDADRLNLTRPAGGRIGTTARNDGEVTDADISVTAASFESINLNAGNGTSRLAVEGVLDGGLISLFTGELNLNDAVESNGTWDPENWDQIGGGALIVSAGTVLTGNGLIDNTLTQIFGSLNPGNSIGTVVSTGDIAFGNGSIYEVEYRVPDVLTDFDGDGALVGRNVVYDIARYSACTAPGSDCATSVAEQDADLVSAAGTVMFASGTAFSVVTDSDSGDGPADFEAALDLPGNTAGEIRYLVARAEGGSTDRVSGVALGDVSLRYVDNTGAEVSAGDTWTNLLLVVGGPDGGVIVDPDVLQASVTDSAAATLSTLLRPEAARPDGESGCLPGQILMFDGEDDRFSSCVWLEFTGQRGDDYELSPTFEETLDTTEVTLGLETEVAWFDTADARVGILWGYRDTTLDLSNASGLEDQIIRVGAYADIRSGNRDFTFSAIYGFHDIEQFRRDTVGDRLNGDYDAESISLHAGFTQWFYVDHCWDVGASASLNWTHISRDGFTESGGANNGAEQIQYDKASGNGLWGFFGVRAKYRGGANGNATDFNAALGLETMLSGNDIDLNGQFVSNDLAITTDTFTRYQDTSLRAEFDIVTKLSDAMTLQARLGGRFASEGQDYTASLNLRYEW